MQEESAFCYSPPSEWRGSYELVSSFAGFAAICTVGQVQHEKGKVGPIRIGLFDTNDVLNVFQILPSVCSISLPAIMPLLRVWIFLSLFSQPSPSRVTVGVPTALLCWHCTTSP